MRTITIKSVSLSFALALNLNIPGAFAQKAATKKRQQSSTSSSATNKSRPRRVSVANQSDESKPASQESTPEQTPQQATETSVKPEVASSNLTESSTEKANTTSTVKPDNTEKQDQAEAPTVSTDELKSAAAPNVSVSLREQIEAAQPGPERIRLQLRLAEELSSTGQKAEAIKELHAITKSDVFDPPGFYNAGNALARLGDAEEAINAYRKAIDQRKGRYSRALNNLGVVLLRVGRWDEADDAFLSALKLESFHYAEASYNLGRVYHARGERDLAIREWRRALKVDPEHRAAASALANSETGIVMRTGSPTKAGSPTRPVNVKSNPRGPAREPSVARSTNNIPAAASRGSNAAQVFKLDTISYDFFQRARDLRDHGKLQEAAKNYEQVISRSRGYFAPANLELSYVLRTLKRDDEALAHLLKVMKRDGGQYPIIYSHIARLYESRGDLVSAEEMYARAALAYQEENNSFLLDLSRVRERQGNFKGALAAMEQYVAAMENQGMKPSWADDRLAGLRQKSSGAQVQPK